MKFEIQIIALFQISFLAACTVFHFIVRSNSAIHLNQTIILLSVGSGIITNFGFILFQNQETNSDIPLK
jgi:hypothetical protein